MALVKPVANYSGEFSVVQSGDALDPTAGGTGLTSFTTGNYIRAATSSTLEERTPTQVRGDIGATTVGGNVFTLTNPSAITFLRVNADNTVSALSAAAFLTAIGGSSTVGTVTSVSVVTANGVSGSVATNTTTPAITLTLGAITPTSVVASGSVTGSNLSGTHTGTSSGTNTGDQTITLTGHVTGTGTGSFATTIAAGVITNAMQANMAANTLSGNNTGSPAAPADLTTAQVRTLLNVADGATANTGTVTSVSVTTANGVSGSVATSTTTPAITLTLGAITPTSVVASGSVTGSNLSGTHTGTSSGTNTGDQTITLTGNVTGSGTGSFATTIAAGAVTLAMQANIATASFMGRNTAATGVQEVLSIATAKTMLNLTGTNSGDQTITLTGDVTGSGTGSFAATIANSSVTLAKMANIATNSLIGRSTAAAGVPEVISVGSGLTLSAGVLSASGGGGGFTWQTITSGNVASAATDNGYIMETGGTQRTVTLPASVAVGFNISVNASGGTVLIVSNGNVIDGVGSGNDLLLEDGNTASLVAKATGSLEVVYGGSSAATGVTSVSVTTANGVSGSVATATTTPAITLTLGAITPTSVAASGAVSGSNLSGTNTGDQTITLTGHVTGTGTGSFATTIAAGVITNAMQANMAANTISGNNTGSPAAPADLTAAQVRTLLNVANGATANTGTVTSVAAADATGISWTGSPITGAGTLTPSLSANLQAWHGLATASKEDAFTKGDIIQGTGVTLTGTLTGRLVGSGNITIDASGGGGSPGGSTTQVQYNNASAFAGASKVEIDSTGNMLLVGNSPKPTAPASGRLQLYALTRAGTQWLEYQRSSGRDIPLQPHVGYNRISQWVPATSSTVTTFGIPRTAVGTASTPTLAGTNLSTSMRRWRQTSGATTNSVADERTAATVCWRGDDTGLGGFTYTNRISLNVTTGGSVGFFGLAASTAAFSTTQTINALVNIIGIGFTRGVDSNWQALVNDGASTPTKSDMGASFPVTSVTNVLTITIFAPSNGSSVWIRVVEETSGAVFEEEFTTNIPSSSTFLALRNYLNNGAFATAVSYDCSGVYLETDY